MLMKVNFGVPLTEGNRGLLINDASLGRKEPRRLYSGRAQTRPAYSWCRRVCARFVRPAAGSPAWIWNHF